MSGGVPFGGDRSIGLSLEEECSHPALELGGGAALVSGALLGVGGFVLAGGVGLAVNAEGRWDRRLERAEVGEPIASRARGFVLAVGPFMSGKGGEESVPGCSLSWSSVVASSLSGLARALEGLLDLRLVFGVVLRAMIAVCVRCEGRG